MKKLKLGSMKSVNTACAHLLLICEKLDAEIMRTQVEGETMRAFRWRRQRLVQFCAMEMTVVTELQRLKTEALPHDEFSPDTEQIPEDTVVVLPDIQDRVAKLKTRFGRGL